MFSSLIAYLTYVVYAERKQRKIEKEILIKKISFRNTSKMFGLC